MASKKVTIKITKSDAERLARFLCSHVEWAAFATARRVYEALEAEVGPHWRDLPAFRDQFMTRSKRKRGSK